MTNDRMSLQALLEKTPDANYLRLMIGSAAQRIWSWALRAALVPAMAYARPTAWRSRND